VVPSDSGIQMKEKGMKEENANPFPAVNPVTLSVQGMYFYKRLVYSVIFIPSCNIGNC